MNIPDERQHHLDERTRERNKAKDAAEGLRSRVRELEGRLRDAEGALLSTAKTIVGVADERLCWCGDCDDEYDEPTCAAARSVATDIRRALDAIDDAALPSQDQPPADEGPQRSTNAGDVKPYTDEEIEGLRRLRSGNSASVVHLNRWLATLDERTRERDEAREDAREHHLDACRLAIESQERGAEVATLRERLAAVEQERNAEAHAASNHAAEAERMLTSACDLRDALDSVAGHLGVDTNTDAEAEARACVSAIAALREEVERLRSAVRGEKE